MEEFLEMHDRLRGGEPVEFDEFLKVFRHYAENSLEIWAKTITEIIRMMPPLTEKQGDQIIEAARIGFKRIKKRSPTGAGEYAQVIGIIDEL